MTALQYILSIHNFGSGLTKTGFWSHEQNKIASNSEIRRWIENGSILINHERVTCNEVIDFPLHSVILFPKSDKRRITVL